MNTNKTHFFLAGNRTLIDGDRFIRDAFTVLTKEELIAIASTEYCEFLITPVILSKWLWALMSDQDRVDFPNWSDVLRHIERLPFNTTLLEFIIAVARLKPHDELSSTVPTTHFAYN